MHIKKRIRTSYSARGSVAEYEMDWVEKIQSSPNPRATDPNPVQPADDPEAESSLVQSGHKRVANYQIPCKIYM